jgi:hypothetical protein
VIVRGTRVRITGVMNDPAPLPLGLEGTVTTVMNQGTSIEQIAVDWDLIEGDHRPRSLMLLRGDPFEVVPPKPATRSRRTTT